ncbi:MAG: ComEC/Rec2 family competence protein [Geodermatophilaceae bacterium]|nr:ComEC/Rec2 family competence protein [Geodermatophilaceae bacterium]
MTPRRRSVGSRLPNARPPPDLRLVPAAAATWAATAAGLHTAPGVGAAAGAALAVLVVVVLAIRTPRSWAAGLAVALTFAAAASLGTAARVAHRDSSPLARLAVTESSATVELTVDDDPRSVAGGFAGIPRVLITATATAVDARTGRWRVDDDIVVLADASSWSGLLPGQRLSAHGTLLPARGGDLAAAALAARGPPELIGLPPPLQRAAGSLRAGLVEAAAVLPEGPRGLLPGLVLGDTSKMDPVLVEQFRDTGLSHLVAVSGANCAIVVGAVIWLLRRVGVPKVALAVVAGLALTGFVVLVRPSPSVLRAATMGAIALIALASGRPRTAVPALAATVALLILVAPELAWSPGFALSVLATAGILAWAPRLTRGLRARRVPAGVAEALAVSIAACAATAPLIAALSSAVSLVSVPANVLAAPAVPLATVLGVLATVISPVSETAAQGLIWAAGLPTRWLVLVAEHGSQLPQASLAWPGGLAGGSLLAVLLAVVVLVAVRWPALRYLGLAMVCGLVLVGLPIRILGTGWPPPAWLFVACDVGQGDALVVNAGPQTALVIDAGPDPVVVDSCLRSLGVRRVPLLVLTHMHADHVDGLDGVLRGRSVGVIEIGPRPDDESAWPRVRAAATRAGVPIETAGVGQVRSVAGVDIEVLAPDRASSGTRSDLNNSSLVLMVSSAGLRVLCTGDIEVDAQRALTHGPVELTADVLKVAHHGSAYQDLAFLDAVDASVAVISVGADNDYGHPSPDLVAQLRGLGMRVLRTDTDGAVAIGIGAEERMWVAARARGSPADS